MPGAGKTTLALALPARIKRIDLDASLQAISATEQRHLLSTP